MTLSERINHYNRQPNHKTDITLGPDNQQWYTVTDEDGVLIDWFPAKPIENEESTPAKAGRCAK